MSDERRRFFRIDDEAEVSFKTISDDEYQAWSEGQQDEESENFAKIEKPLKYDGGLIRLYKVKNILDWMRNNIDLEKIDIFFQRAWSTISKGAENISPHAHDQSHISFAYYLKKNSTDSKIVFLDENRSNEIIPRLFTSKSVDKKKSLKKGINLIVHL